MNVKTIYHKRRPDTTTNIKEEFTLKNATVFGGYYILADFIQTKKLETAAVRLSQAQPCPCL